MAPSLVPSLPLRGTREPSSFVPSLPLRVTRELSPPPPPGGRGNPGSRGYHLPRQAEFPGLTGPGNEGRSEGRSMAPSLVPSLPLRGTRELSSPPPWRGTRRDSAVTTLIHVILIYPHYYYNFNSCNFNLSALLLQPLLPITKAFL
jgi:hypothetical protein